LKGGDHQAVINLSDTYWQEMVHAYLACVSFVDAQIGKVITALEESGQAHNTIIVLWSDHGQHLGEKKKWRKQSLWEEATRVPLFFKIPQMNTAGRTCDETVSLLDIYPTLLNACQLPDAPKLDGQSLVPLIKNPDAERSEPVLMSWYYGNHAVRSKDWRYIQYRDGTEELYRHPLDAGEHQNLAGDPDSAQTIAELRKWIPTAPALPPGATEWEGDKLDQLVDEWKTSQVPDWLK
ncbi:MAG: sulfatase-like hydrolase/transferase, partial [Verrucomicrobiales bacterium]